jgi:hypothetical protein
VPRRKALLTSAPVRCGVEGQALLTSGWLWTFGSPCNQLNSGRWLTQYRGCWVFCIALLEINSRL